MGFCMSHVCCMLEFAFLLLKSLCLNAILHDLIFVLNIERNLEIISHEQISMKFHASPFHAEFCLANYGSMLRLFDFL